MPRTATRARYGEPRIHVVDSVSEDGAKLVEMTSSDLQALRVANPGLRVVPEVFYTPAIHMYFVRSKSHTATSRGGKRVSITVLGPNDEPVRGAMVVAFSDFAREVGDDAITNASGQATLLLARGTTTIERVFVYPEMDYWGWYKRNLKIGGPIIAKLKAIDLKFRDGLRHYIGSGKDEDGRGVRVGIVDTGVASDHPDLTVSGGACTIAGQPESAYGPVGDPHGTHVAGIVAAHGKSPNGVRGVAPRAELYSYRVFGARDGASNFTIIKAIDRAVQDKCDLINLSLGGGPRDAALEAAIGDAHLAGSVCVVAAGNESRSPVSVPAAYQLAVAVTASCRKGTFPAGSTETGDVAAPYGKDKKDFLAAFSNVGPEVDTTGPGVGIISTVPGGYAVMSGTSMATPAVTGVAARYLAQTANQHILSARRDENRGNEITRLLLNSCQKLGFKPIPDCEGAGMPKP